MARKTVITLEMTTQQVIMAMSEGNMGALNVLMALLTKFSSEGAMVMLSLDTFEIRGSKLWVLFKYICDNDIVKMERVLRACQLGGLGGATKEALHKAIDNHENCLPHGFDTAAAVAAADEWERNYDEQRKARKG